MTPDAIDTALVLLPRCPPVTWDAMGESNFSRQLGFLQSGSDVNGMIHKAMKASCYLGMVGQIPFLHKLLKSFPFLGQLAPFTKATRFCVQQLQERTGRAGPEKERDFLRSFVEAKKTYPTVGNDKVIGYFLLNVRSEPP